MIFRYNETNTNYYVGPARAQDLIVGSKILSVKWKNPSCITLVLADGTIIYIRIKNLFTNDYYCVVDKFFKFPDPAMDGNFLNRNVRRVNLVIHNAHASLIDYVCITA
jgi:hypothetical protein